MRRSYASATPSTKARQSFRPGFAITKDFKRRPNCIRSGPQNLNFFGLPIPVLARRVRTEGALAGLHFDRSWKWIELENRSAIRRGSATKLAIQIVLRQSVILAGQGRRQVADRVVSRDTQEMEWPRPGSTSADDVLRSRSPENVSRPLRRERRVGGQTTRAARGIRLSMHQSAPSMMLEGIVFGPPQLDHGAVVNRSATRGSEVGNRNYHGVRIDNAEPPPRVGIGWILNRGRHPAARDKRSVYRPSHRGGHRPSVERIRPSAHT